jgi:hypothetical protein
MNTDPAIYIYAAGVLGATMGFFTCARMSSARIRRANLEGYLEAVRYQKSLGTSNIEH